MEIDMLLERLFILARTAVDTNAISELDGGPVSSSSAIESLRGTIPLLYRRWNQLIYQALDQL